MKAKKERVRERVYLTFPKDLIKEPILSLLAKQFDVVLSAAPPSRRKWVWSRWKSTGSQPKSKKLSVGSKKKA